MSCTIQTIFIIVLCSVILFKPTYSLPANALLKNGDELNCDVKNNAKIDAFVAKYMVIGRHGRLYPENAKQLKMFCK